MTGADVLLLDLPPMLEGIVETVLQARPHLRVLRVAAAGRPTAAAAAHGASLVVVSRPDPADLAEVDADFAAAAGLSVLALNQGGTWACLHVLTLATRRLDDISAAEILYAADQATDPAAANASSPGGRAG